MHTAPCQRGVLVLPAYRLHGPNSTVFQAETLAVGETARVLREKNAAGKNIIINYDSQATIMTVTSTQIKSITTSATVSECNKLGKDNNVLLRWIPVHKGHAGYKKADSLSKEGVENSDLCQKKPHNQ